MNKSTHSNAASEDDDDRIPEDSNGERASKDEEVLDLDDLLEQSEKIQAEQDTHDTQE